MTPVVTIAMSTVQMALIFRRHPELDLAVDQHWQRRRAGAEVQSWR
jgi:hypothetical protein